MIFWFAMPGDDLGTLGDRQDLDEPPPSGPRGGHGVARRAGPSADLTYFNARITVLRASSNRAPGTRENLMDTDDSGSMGNPPAREEVDELLRSRMKILGLDVDAIGRDFHEVFDKVRKNCPRCGDREACAIDLRHDPNALLWEAYCPNSEVLNALVALTETGN